MSKLLVCGLYCVVISVWGIIQLGLMGIIYKAEALVFIEDVEPEEYTDYDDFVQQTKANYSIVAINCWIAAIIYLVMIGISCLCIKSARRSARKQALRMEEEITYDDSTEKQK